MVDSPQVGWLSCGVHRGGTETLAIWLWEPAALAAYGGSVPPVLRQDTERDESEQTEVIPCSWI